MKKVYSLLTVLALISPVIAQKSTMTTTTVEAILAKPASFNKKDVNVSGTVAEFKAKTSQKGNKYTTFKIYGKDPKKTINVYLPEHLNPKLGVKDGMKVLVRGLYQQEKKVGTTVYKNEILAMEKGKPYGVFPMKKGLEVGKMGGRSTQ